ncbi:MAG: putative Zn peptidase [Marmoricola sp.]|nr:putative Zn peptidase [Marmoricola sp.]
MADRSGGARGLTYDPGADAALRYPEWIVTTAHLGGVIPEVMCRARRVILIEVDQSPAAQRSSLAHAVAHLDLGHARTTAGFFENREEAEADRLAAERLIPLDAFAAALVSARVPAAIASELGVDLPMLRVREANLTRAERRRLGRGVRAGAPST